jgi:hypothetical protein
MGEKRLHPSSRTNREMRRVIQQSNGSIESIARDLSINPKTVAKWKHRNSVEDAPMDRRSRGSQVLNMGEINLFCRLRKQSNLPLDKCHHHLKQIFPWLCRSTLYRCFLRHGLGRIDDRSDEMSAIELSLLIKDTSERAIILREYTNMFVGMQLATICK